MFEKGMTDVNTFKSLKNILIGTINYLEDENKNRKIYTKKKALSTKVKTVDTLLAISTTPTSVTLCGVGFSLIVKPVSNEIACALAIFNKTIFEMKK